MHEAIEEKGAYWLPHYLHKSHIATMALSEDIFRNKQAKIRDAGRIPPRLIQDGKISASIGILASAYVSVRRAENMQGKFV